MVPRRRLDANPMDYPRSRWSGSFFITAVVPPLCGRETRLEPNRLDLDLMCLCLKSCCEDAWMQIPGFASKVPSGHALSASQQRSLHCVAVATRLEPNPLACVAAERVSRSTLSRQLARPSFRITLSEHKMILYKSCYGGGRAWLRLH